MCCLFDDGPVEDDPRAYREGTFQISMMDALYKNQPWCCCTYLLPCCSAYYTRYKVLDGDLTKYTCCQGYMDNRCFHAGTCGEQSNPSCCLCLETFFCLGPSVSSSRMFVMDQYDLRPDPCDNRIIRFTNCLMLLSCVCDVLSIFIREIRHLAHLIHVVANCVFYSTIGCMASQVNREVDFRRKSSFDYVDLSGQEFAGDGGTVASPILGEAIVVKEEPKY